MLAGFALAWPCLLAGPVTVEGGGEGITSEELRSALEARVGEELEPWSVEVRVEGERASISYESSWDQGSFEVTLSGVGEDDLRLVASSVASSLTPPPPDTEVNPVEGPEGATERPRDALRPETYWLGLGPELGGWAQLDLGGGVTFTRLLLAGHLGLGVSASGRHTLTRRVGLDTIRASPRVMGGAFVGRRFWLGAYLDPGVALSIASGDRVEAFVTASVAVGPTLLIGLTPVIGLQLSLGLEWLSPETRVVGPGGPVSYGPVHLGGSLAVVFGR